MAAWAYVLTGFLFFSFAVLLTLAFAFSYQHVHCVGDKRIICWADWTCSENGGTNVLREYFDKGYASKCLFGSNPNDCNCGANGTTSPPTDDSDLGYYRNVVGGDNSQPNPYNPGTVQPYSANGYNTPDTYNTSPQNLCGNVYPVPVNNNSN